MKSRRRTHEILEVVFLLLGLCSIAAATDQPRNEDSKYLDAVREFADNVLKYGRDTYGPKQTPLFVDGLNVNTHEPVKWIAPNGDRWILSNLASQQNLFRTLDGLTRITGDPKYKQAAMDAIKYAFENLRSPNGLLYWGGHQAYDAAADRPCGREREVHELKGFYPYYELMWEVNPRATKQFIEAFWSGHILDWSNLDMDRHCLMTQVLKKPWDYEYKGEPVFFKGSGMCFINTGSDLSYAAAMLSNLSSQDTPLVWAKRLAHRYVETRNPKIGISSWVFITVNPAAKALYGDEILQKLGPTGYIFPQQNHANKIWWSFHFGYDAPTPGTILNQATSPWICQLMLGELLGEEGKEFIQWTIEELTAWGKVAFRGRDNVFVPMSLDGTSLEGYVCKEDGPLGLKGTSLEPVTAGSAEFWAYALSYCLTNNEFMWEIARSIAIGNNYGDLGIASGDEPRLNLQTDISDPYVMWVFLELYRNTKKQTFLEMGRRIGDNILARRFYKGFIVPDSQYTFTKLDSIDTLALLHLYAAIVGDNSAKIPKVWPATSFFEVPYRSKDDLDDNQIIYTLKGLSEPKKSLQEAAAEGNIEMVRSIIVQGTVVDNREDGYRKTALQRATISGHKEIVELLLANGANPDARDNYFASSLHYAAQNGHKDIVELLVTHGADINAKNSEGKTALDVALDRNQKDIVELLVAKGAEVSSIYVAARIGDLAKVRGFLEKGADVNMRDAQRKTALHIASANGHKEIVELLLANGADVNAGGYYNKTAAEYAMGADHREIVELLISKGADISPLHFAIYIKDQAKAKSLIESGADVNKRTPNGTTPLSRAADIGLKDIAELHLVKGANVNAKNNWDWTPLHSAAEKGHRDIVELLLAKGADVNAKDGDDLVPLWYAEDEGNTEIAELLRKYEAKE